MFPDMREDISSLDGLVFRFNPCFSGFYKDLTDNRLHGGTTLRWADALWRDVERLHAAVLNLPPATGSDALLQAHLRHSLDAQVAFLDFAVYHGKKQGIKTPDNLVLSVFGETAQELLHDGLRHCDFEKDVRARALHAEIAPYLIDSDVHDIRKKIGRIIKVIRKEFIVEYCVQKGYLPGDRLPLEVDNIAICLHPAYKPGAQYQHNSATGKLSDIYFIASRRNGTIVINPAYALVVLGHEIAGHGCQGAFSECMPKTLTGDDANYCNIVSMPTVEGFALSREEVGEHYANENRDKLAFEFRGKQVQRVPADEKQLRYALLANDNELIDRMHDAYFNYLLLRETCEPGFSAKEHFACDWQTLFGCPPMPDYFEYHEPWQQLDILNDLSYALGNKLMAGIHNDIKSNYTAEFIAKNQRTINEVLATGSWAYQLYPQWVTHCLDDLAGYEGKYRAALHNR
ncbi:hypothetical protein HY642_03690 [Candidatus Woesearchaeota archaeon]|nr:hypothetical protein [Candidatus Woesearchaeota archaeon]